MKYIDIHSHIHFGEFDIDREEVLARMERGEVGAILVGTDRASSENAITLSKKHSYLFATVGLHPNDTQEEVFDSAFYKTLAQHKKVVAIGECGLDYFRTGKSEKEKELQQHVFREHIRIASELNLPLMIHVRNAHEDCIAILRESKRKYGENIRGNIHFFSGSREIAEQYFALGFTISFTGVITFAREYDDVVKSAPAHMLMAETDCPFVAPIPHRGKRNESVFVQEVVKQLATLRGESEESMAKTLLSNSKRVFHLGD